MRLDAIQQKLRKIQTLTPNWIRDGHDADAIYLPLKTFQSLMTHQDYQQAENILDKLLTLISTPPPSATPPQAP